jgi:uncharacterized protein YuzE
MRKNKSKVIGINGEGGKTMGRRNLRSDNSRIIKDILIDIETERQAMAIKLNEAEAKLVNEMFGMRVRVGEYVIFIVGSQKKVIAEHLDL